MYINYTYTSILITGMYILRLELQLNPISELSMTMLSVHDTHWLI